MAFAVTQGRRRDGKMAAKPDMAVRLPFVTKMLYGSGTIAFGLKDQGFSALLMLFYNQVIGLPAAWVGAAIMSAMVADAVIDPLIGQISDNSQSRWGRRHPFMYASALPMAGFYFLLWTPPHAPHLMQFFYLLMTAVAVRVSISLYEIPSTALLAEFTTDYHERTRLVSYRFFFGVVAGVLMNVVTFKFLLHPTAQQPIGQLNAQGYRIYGAISAAFMFVSVLVSSLGTHQQIAALQPPPRGKTEPPARLLQSMKEVLFHKTYASVLVASLFFAITGGLTSALGVYFSTYLWRLTANQIATVSVGAFIGIGLAFIFALPLSARFGKKATAISLYGLALVASISPLALRLMDAFPPNGASSLVPILMGQVAFTTMCGIAASVLAVSMVADVTEQVQLSTGRQAEGLLFSAATMVNKAVSGMGVLVSGLLLALIKFPVDAKPDTVDSASLLRLAIAFIGVTTVTSLLAIVCLAFYPITKKAQSEAVRRLAAADDQAVEHPDCHRTQEPDSAAAPQEVAIKLRNSKGANR
jgi:GPH family glycoside/pentoside/hexuronide:cation symporter